MQPGEKTSGVSRPISRALNMPRPGHQTLSVSPSMSMMTEPYSRMISRITGLVPRRLMLAPPLPVTTATALEVLGPDFRAETRLLAKVPPREGVLEGDLILRGGGDPLLSLSDLAAWAAELQRQGLRRIHGRVLGDGSLFTGSLFDDHWSWGDIGNGYGSPVAGLNLEHNRYTAVFAPGRAEGQPAQLVEIVPEVPGIT